MSNNTYDVEYLGMLPGVDDGIGVGIAVFRSANGSLTTINLALSRAALERMLEDTSRLLASESALNNLPTLQQARKERVRLEEDVLDKFGLNDFHYLGKSED